MYSAITLKGIHTRTNDSHVMYMYIKQAGNVLSSYFTSLH